MSVKIETLENKKALLTIEVPAEEFENAVNKVYMKNKNKVEVPGFRKGKVPRKVIEKMFGEGFFYEDAANMLIPDAYGDAYEEATKELQIMSQPEISIVQIESGKPFIFTGEVCLRPDVELGQYLGLEVEKPVIEVTEKELADALQGQLDKNARIENTTERPVKNGDDILLDFQGYCDDEPIPGGEGHDYELTVGSGVFIPGFEEQLIGVMPGEDVVVNVDFPESYHAPELAGRPAVFNCRVNVIKDRILSELNDEFASEVSDFETLEEFKEDLKRRIFEEKTEDAQEDVKNQLIQAAVDNATVELADPIIEAEARQELDSFMEELKSQNISFQQYVEITGMTPEKILEDVRPGAERKVKTTLVLDEIAKQEKIEISDEEFNTRFEELAKNYQMSIEDFMGLVGEKGIERLKQDFAVEIAIDRMVESAVITEKKEEAEEEAQDAE